MYNKKSRISAILIITAAALLLGLMVLMHVAFAGKNPTAGEVVSVFVYMLYFFWPIYLGAFAFVVVGLIFGIKVLKQQRRKKLIRYNVATLITTFLAMPLLMFDCALAVDTLRFDVQIGRTSAQNVLYVIFAVITTLCYLAALVAQIVAIVRLRRSPKEDDSTTKAESAATDTNTTAQQQTATTA